MDWSGHQTAPYRHPLLAGPVPATQAVCPPELSRMRPVGGLPAARRHVGHVSGDNGPRRHSRPLAGDKAPHGRRVRPTEPVAGQATTNVEEVEVWKRKAS